MKRLFGVGWLLFALCSGGCSDGGDVTVPSPTPTVQDTRTEDGVEGPLLERAESSQDVDADFQSGQDVFITDDGFKPKQLVAKQNAEIRFTNETGTTQGIHFVTGAFDDLAGIEPGRSASFESESTVSITYELAGDADVRGQIQIEPYYEPGETATPQPSG